MFPHSVARFEMLDTAKNKLRVKVSYLMIALIVTECICMVIEDKKPAPLCLCVLSQRRLLSLV